MQGRALTDHDDAARFHELAGMVGDAAEHDLAVSRVDAPLHASPQRAGLLEDLLEHVVRILAELDLLEVELELRDLRGDRHVVDRRRAERVARQLRDGVVLERNRLGRVRDDRAGVRGDDVLILADAHHERRALARHHEDVRLLLADHRDRVGAGHLAQRRLHGDLEVAFVQLADQMREHLGVGVRSEDVPLVRKVGLESRVVLDDAVVDDRNAVAARAVIEVRVGVDLGDLAVGRPARVARSRSIP